MNGCATSLYTRMKNITMDTEEIKRTIIDFFDQLFEKLVKIDGFLGKFKSPKLMREKMQNVNRLIFLEEIEEAVRVTY